MTGDGPVRAVTFVVNRAHTATRGGSTTALVAAHLASATGSLGSCCRVSGRRRSSALRSIGLRDRALERLQRLTGKAPP